MLNYLYLFSVGKKIDRFICAFYLQFFSCISGLEGPDAKKARTIHGALVMKDDVSGTLNHEK